MHAGRHFFRRFNNIDKFNEKIRAKISKMYAFRVEKTKFAFLTNNTVSKNEF